MNPELLHRTPVETQMPQPEVDMQFTAMMTAEGFGGPESDADMLAMQGLMQAVEAMQQLDIAAELDSQDGGSRTLDAIAGINLATPSLNQDVNVSVWQDAIDMAAQRDEQAAHAAYAAQAEASLREAVDSLFSDDDEKEPVGAR